MTFSGDLANISLGDVFQNLLGNRLTGTLIVSAAGWKRYVLFHEGYVVGYSLGVNRGLPVVEHLVQRQYVAERDIAKALKRKRAKKSTLRRALAETGLLEEAAFCRAVAELIEESLFKLLALKNAEFVFQEGKPAPRVFDSEQRAAKVSLDPSAMLMEGARRQDELKRIQNVITSDQDLFVSVDGWDEFELSDLQYEVAERLDGYTEVAALLVDLPYSRFEILKAIHALVGFELARPLSRQELEDMIEEAIAEEQFEDAVVLLRRALVIERSNSEFRASLASLLESLDRPDEAATELAVLGYQESSAGRFESALSYYDRACVLKPGDIGILEKRVEIIRSMESGDYTQALLDFTDRLIGAGLTEKARSILVDARGDASRADAVLFDTQLAEIAAHLGDYKESTEIYSRLAENLSKGERDRRLELLRKAAAHAPDDAALRQQIEDLESGRAEERRQRVRRVTSLVTTIVVLAMVGAMGIVEMIASHRIIQGIEDQLEAISDGRPSAAAEDLQDVGGQFAWTLSGARARKLQRRLADVQRRSLRQRLERGQTEAILDGLLSAGVPEQVATLEVMVGLDDPRLIPIVARFYLRAKAARAVELAERVLGDAHRHRAAGHGADWMALLEQLHPSPASPASPAAPEVAERARRLWGWLHDGG